MPEKTYVLDARQVFDGRINNSNSGIQKPSDWNGIVTNNLNDGIISSDENNLVRGAEHAAITRITYETAVSGSILTLVYGDNGSNLAKLREVLLCNYLT
ncbi:RNA-binding KH domain-containing protein PEPPER [Zea mays]|uniref:RNA-binding KH domain-containing protein PEPPER n=1 Tax=Zea mays TaxID=4577 RepID=A0A1D6Q4C9_MAIZE|nr:RNA-binding KH domain-containing protein PEPPER [Zea mays]